MTGLKNKNKTLFWKLFVSFSKALLVSLNFRILSESASVAFIQGLNIWGYIATRPMNESIYVLWWWEKVHTYDGKVDNMLEDMYFPIRALTFLPMSVVIKKLRWWSSFSNRTNLYFHMHTKYMFMYDRFIQIQWCHNEWMNESSLVVMQVFIPTELNRNAL